MKRTTAFLVLLFLITPTVPDELSADVSIVPFQIIIGAVIVSAFVGGMASIGIIFYNRFQDLKTSIREIKMEREEITIELDHNVSRVQCKFILFNLSMKTFTGPLYFPFLVDEDQLYPEDIAVCYTRGDDVVKPKTKK